MAYTDKADWVQIDPASLEANAYNLYLNYKEAYKQAKAIREQFEQAMQADVPAGKRMVFGYNFGKLSVAIVADDRPAVKPKQATLSLADYLARQA